MAVLNQILNFFLHVDENLALVISNYGSLTYGLLFLIIFMETGFVVTPFLPGDSLLFAAGTFGATSTLNITWLFILLTGAAFLGDTVNYWVGHFIGPRVFREDTKLFKKEYLLKAQSFYERHGGKAIIFARFIPIIRTFAPFVAGIGKMNYGRFLLFNLTGGILWVSIFLFAGYFFGNLPFIKENFHYAVIVIIVLSLYPIFHEWKKSKKVSSNASE